MSTGTFRIGTSGYQYPHWKGVLYPDDRPKTRWFETYAAEFDTVEINNTFYNLPRAETFAHWAEQAPANFLYTLKFSRFGTHLKKLKEPENSVDRFLEASAPLGEHRGPILVQLPPRWKPNPERLDAFLARGRGKARWAVELRDERWLRDDVYDILRRHQAGLVIHDLLPHPPLVQTAPWVYLRFHGDDYTRRYSLDEIKTEADRIRGRLESGADVYAYFNNDGHGHAVLNARELREQVASRA